MNSSARSASARGRFGAATADGGRLSLLLPYYYWSDCVGASVIARS